MPLKPLPFSGPTEVTGFLFAGVHAGIKRKPDALDLGLIQSVTPAAAAGLFTTNLVKAPPVVLARERLASGLCQAIVVNSGNANACTGERGYEDAQRTTRLLAEALAIPEALILPASTGVIGRHLPMKEIQQAIPALVAHRQKDRLWQAGKAMQTTDTFDKIVGTTCEVSGKEVRICGIAKGAGMIQPNMATMLAFLVTDAKIAPAALHQALREAGEDTFNAITVDGEMSTNDCLIILANGQAGNEEIQSGQPAFGTFVKALREACDFLARQIVRDGEGVSKFVELHVTGVEDRQALKALSQAIANSYLVRTALHGEDANWGRILSAAGACGARLGLNASFDRASISFNDLFVLKDGQVVGDEAEKQAHQIMTREEFEIRVILDPHHTQTWHRLYTTDLTPEYIKINASYRS